MTGVLKSVGTCYTAPSPDNRGYITDVMSRSIPVTTELKAQMFMPPVASGWLFGLHERSFSEGWVHWDPVEHAVVFSIWDSLDTKHSSDGIFYPEAIQHRYFRKHGPKCITTKANDDTKVQTFMGEYPDARYPLVIVEDPLSMHSIYGAHWEHNAYCLYGAHMDISQLVSLKKNGVKDVVVWLDNDNDQVLKNADLIARRAMGLGLGARVICDVKEPKHYDGKAIRKILGGIE
jgi:hypothetical protein